MINNIGIISGGGSLPIAIGESLIKKKYNVIFFVIEEFHNNKIYHNYNSKPIKLNSAKNIIKILRSNNINNILMAGNITRPSLTDLSFDFQTFKLAKKLLLNKTGDNDLLISIRKFFEENGFNYFDWKNHCQDLFADKKNLTSIKPTSMALKNLKKGLSVFKTYGNLDVGQSLIVQNQIILGLEAAEGTDNLILRCKNLKKSGDKGILIKLSKYNQSNIIDIPTIGPKTINLLNENDYEGVFLENNNCLILDKVKAIQFAEQNKIFISTCKKID